MRNDNKFWPFATRLSIIWTIILTLTLLILFAIARATIDWPTDAIQTPVLIGVAVVGLLPVLLALLDIIIQSGGAIEFKGIKIDFSKLAEIGVSAFTLPANIGIRGEPANDSNTANIIAVLRETTTCGTIIIDLEDGLAWWETRLLVLLNGASRIRKPDKVVFIGTESEKKECFYGWANPADLFPYMERMPLYKSFLQFASAVASEWALVEPSEPVGLLGGAPLPPAGLYPPPKASNYQWMATDHSGHRNQFLQEQILQYELGNKIEKTTEGSKSISHVRLEDLFGPALKKYNIDQDWSEEEQTRSFLSNDAPYIAITQGGKYISIVSRMAIYNEMMKSLVDKKKDRKQKAEKSGGS